jgi:hypothetical protein
VIDLREASEALVRSLAGEAAPIEGLRRRLDRRRRRRRLTAGGGAVVLVVAAVALGLSRGHDSTAVVTSPTTTTSIPASDPEALAACRASVPEPSNVAGAPIITVVAAYTTTVAEVDAWLDQLGGPSVVGGRFPGLAPGTVLSLCFEDGPFHPSFPPGGMPESETNRNVSALRGTVETQLEIGPIDRIPIERPHPPTTRSSRPPGATAP